MKKGEKIVPASHPLVAKKVEKSLNLSLEEGAVVSISNNFGLSYFSPFALAMNATASQVGILDAIMYLLPGLVQLKAPALLEKFSRKRITLWAVMARVLLLLPIILCGYLFYKGYPYVIWIFIFLVGVYYAIGAVAYPAWFSWMGSLVPEAERGRYFSKRNRIEGLFGILGMVLAALILEFMVGYGISRGNALIYTLEGFGILFIISLLTRFWSWELLKKHYEPYIKIRRKDEFTFFDFLKRAPSTPFGRFSLVRGFFSIAIGISSPFWAVYMLRDLGFSYTWFMAITVSSTVFHLFFLPSLGKFSDRFGNVMLMRVCSWFVFATPFLWFFSSFISGDLAVKIYLLLVPGIVGGFGWAGYTLATNNYVYDAVGPNKRGFGVSYMNLIVGVGMFVGAGIGSFIAWQGVSFMNSLLFIFLVSGVARGIVSLFGIRYLSEVRNVKKIRSNHIFLELVPVQGIVGEIHSFEHLVKKVEHYV